MGLAEALQGAIDGLQVNRVLVDAFEESDNSDIISVILKL
jgi:hypothetical protein